MTLEDILKAAPGGAGVSALAGQFGLSQEQTQAAVQALIPAFSAALQQLTTSAAGLGGLLAQMAGGAIPGASADPSRAGAVAGPGGAILGPIFGSQQAIGAIAEQAAQASGVSAQVIAQMMPAIASMLISALTQALSAQGLGGLLGQLAGVLTGQGGLGPAGAADAGGGLGDLIGSVVGAAQKSAGAQAQVLQTSLGSLSAAFQAGAQASQAHQQALGEILQSLAAKNPKS